VPTVQVGAIRLRLLDDVYRPAPAGHLRFALQIAAEPKVGWLKANALHIDKAVDDQGHRLSQTGAAYMLEESQEALPACGSLMPLHLKKGEKPAKALKELKGRIVAEVLSRPKTILTVEDLLKADKKEFKVPNEGVWAIEATRVANGIVVSIESSELPSSGRQPVFKMTCVTGAKGSEEQRRMEVNLSPSEGTALTRQRIHIQLAKGKTTLRVELRRQRAITVTIPFAFKDVPLP
jgi:hypothetical protein